MSKDIVTTFGRMVDGRRAEYEAEVAIAEILGVELLGVSFDDYDSSFEIYPMEPADVAPSMEQHASILALGCERYWINFPDDTERYAHKQGIGERKKAAIAGRWTRHNQFRESKRRDEEAATTIATLRAEAEELRRDAARYRWLRNYGNPGNDPVNRQRGLTMAVDGAVKLHLVFWCTKENLDAAIDSAMQAEKERA